jgi:hypothetical protein
MGLGLRQNFRESLRLAVKLLPLLSPGAVSVISSNCPRLNILHSGSNHRRSISLMLSRQPYASRYWALPCNSSSTTRCCLPVLAEVSHTVASTGSGA